jgi:hypothetical protein
MFRRKKKNKEVIELESCYLTFTIDDVVNFYNFLRCYDETSINIGIVGDNDRFKWQMRNILETLKKKNCRVIQNKEGTRFRILFDDDIEIDYWQIKNINDLDNKKFKKFI